MMRKLVLALAVSFAAAETIDPSTIDFDKILRPLWNQTDSDGDGFLSLSEFTAACERLGLAASFFTSHQQSYTVAFGALDGSNDLKLTIPEFVDAAVNFANYKDGLIEAFTNGAGKVPEASDIVEVDPIITTAEAALKVSLTMAGSIGDIYKGTRDKMRAWFAQTAGVPTAAVILTFLPGSVVVDATIYTPDAAAAETAKAAMPSTAAGFNAVPAFAGFTVTQDPTYEVDETEPLPIPIVAGIGAGLLVLGLFTCVMVSIGAGKERKAKGVAPQGCCSTGCCSFFAVQQWAFSNFGAIIVFCGALAYLALEMEGVQNIFVDLIDVIAAMRISTFTAVADLMGELPPDILDQIEANKSHAKLLRFYVLGPGVLAIVFLALASLLGCSTRRKGTYCCTKLFVILSNILLILALVFYAIFAGAAVVINYAPPAIKENLNSIEGLCTQIPAQIQQLTADNQHAINIFAGTPGQNQADLAALQLEIDKVTALNVQITLGCDSIKNLFDEMIVVFLPGLLCVIAIVFALFTNNSLCCAAGCCKAPPKTKPANGATVKQEV